MGSSENFCLRWNDFEANVSGTFKELRDESDFFDVTLVCDNSRGRPLQAHKLILSACSPLFKKMLRSLSSVSPSHPGPLLYLRGVRHRDLEYVLDFMYHGEVNVAQDDLNAFLAAAEDLQVKGLTEHKDGTTPAKRPASGGGGGSSRSRSGGGGAAATTPSSSSGGGGYRPGPASKRRRPNHLQADGDAAEAVKMEPSKFESVDVEGGEEDDNADDGGMDHEDAYDDDNYDDDYGGGYEEGGGGEEEMGEDDQALGDADLEGHDNAKGPSLPDRYERQRDGRVLCLDCDKYYSSVTNALGHDYAMHRIQPIFHCFLCKKSVWSHKNFRDHVTRKHRGARNPGEKFDPEKFGKIIGER